MYTRSLKRRCQRLHLWRLGRRAHGRERDRWYFSILLSTRAHVFTHTCGSHRTTSTVTFRNTAHLPLRQALSLAWKQQAPGFSSSVSVSLGLGLQVQATAGTSHGDQTQTCTRVRKVLSWVCCLHSPLMSLRKFKACWPMPCNPNTWEDEQEECWEFRSNLGYNMRLFPKKSPKKKKVLMHMVSWQWKLKI